MSKKINLISSVILILFMGLLLQNCAESIVDPVDKGLTDPTLPYTDATGVKSEKLKATGTVEIIWKGGNGNNPDVEPKRAFAVLTAHQAYDNKPARGEFIYQVMTEDLIIKREIIAEVHKVAVDEPYTWVVAKVISDSKGCSGGDTQDGHSVDCPGRISGGPDSGPDSGHDEGCGEDHTDDGTDGGCGEDHTDDGTDGGCGEDHTDDGTDGGCGEDHTDDGTDGGCGEDHTDDGTDGGCGEDHTDDGTDDGGCSGDDHSGGSPGGSSAKPKGHSCRVEQRVFIMVYDGGTPGVDGDEIEWKWFYKSPSNKPHWPVSDTILQWSDFESWHLCEKVIIEGNLVVYSGQKLPSL